MDSVTENEAKSLVVMISLVASLVKKEILQDLEEACSSEEGFRRSISNPAEAIRCAYELSVGLASYQVHCSPRGCE
jgi:hypothetical protein